MKYKGYQISILSTPEALVFHIPSTHYSFWNKSIKFVCGSVCEKKTFSKVTVTFRYIKLRQIAHLGFWLMMKNRQSSHQVLGSVLGYYLCGL